MVVKINKINDTFWYYPTILTTSKRFWHARPYKNLLKLLKVEDLSRKNFTISINKDKEFIIFRQIQKMHGYSIFLSKQQINQIEQEKTPVREQIPNLKKNIFLVYDAKSLKFLRKGYIPYFSPTWIAREFSKHNDKNIYLHWRKTGFEKVSPKPKK